MLRPTKTILTAGLLCLFLSACGFKLRGSIDLPAIMDKTYISGVIDNDLKQYLVNQLKSSDVTVVSTLDAATVVLQIDRNEIKKRVLSFDSAGRAREYELEYFLVYSLLDTQNQPLISAQEIKVLRDYNYDVNNALASSEEEQRLTKNMKDFAVRSMLRQINIGLRKL